MGNLGNYLKYNRTKKLFILDRNDGQCYVCRRRTAVGRASVIFGDRLIEQLKVRGNWTWVILDRIPGGFKGGKINERLQRDFNTHKVY